MGGSDFDYTGKGKKKKKNKGGQNDWQKNMPLLQEPHNEAVTPVSLKPSGFVLVGGGEGKKAKPKKKGG